MRATRTRALAPGMVDARFQGVMPPNLHVVSLVYVSRALEKPHDSGGAAGTPSVHTGCPVGKSLFSPHKKSLASWMLTFHKCLDSRVFESKRKSCPANHSRAVALHCAPGGQLKAPRAVFQAFIRLVSPVAGSS